MLAKVNGDLRKDAVVQGRSDPDAPSQGDKFRRFEIKAPAKALLAGGDHARSRQQLDQKFGIAVDKTDNTQLFDSKSVSASFGRTILIGALYAIIFSIFLIVAYLTFRFEFKYALPTIVALFHDVIITIGVYSLTGRVVTAATVAAVLTVLGYSLYDTIIVFDRVRENTPLLRKNSFAQIVNVSIWETLTRSLNTSLITLFPIAHAARLRRRDAQGLRVRAADRHRRGRLFVDLHRGAAAEPLEGPRDRVPRREAVGIEKATLGTVTPGMAGGTGGGATVDRPRFRRSRRRPRTWPSPCAVPELSDEEREAREAARRRREERRRKQGRGHGRRT